MKATVGLKFEQFYNKGNINNFTAEVRAVVDNAVIVVLVTYPESKLRPGGVSVYKIITLEEFIYFEQNKTYKKL